MSKNILFITEGREDEPRLIRRICKVYSGFRGHEICYYNTSLYELMEAIYKGDRSPKDCDLLEVFKESKTATKKELLDGSYTDIYMIFDLDPHYQLYDKWKDKLPEMLEWYSESSLYGKLYINYPMMQSYMHVDDLDSDSFENMVMDISNFNGSDYKTRI